MTNSWTRIFIVLSVLIWAKASFAQLKGIPTKYMNDPAIDLVKDGKKLMPEDVNALIEKSKGRFDISTLNPVETSDLWKNDFPKTLPADKVIVDGTDEVQFLSNTLIESGFHRFNVRVGTKIHTMIINKNIHAFLLAKNLLRKIGYQIPDIQWLPQVTVKFKSKLEKQNFLMFMEQDAMVGNPKNWVVEDLDDALILQDVVILESVHRIYNLAVDINPDMIQGRRLMSALAVPMAMVNLEESVNMFRWNLGRASQNQVDLFHNNLDMFQCSWDDARWITRRIAKLSREDWKEIVDKSYFPKPVEMVLVEKLISRRNSAMRLFKIDADRIKVDADVTHGVELVKGKVVQEKFPGYSARFAFGDPDSPLSASEMSSWYKSRAISTSLDVMIGQINQIKDLGTDIEGKNIAKFQKYMEEAVKKAQETKTPVEVPLKAWTFPTVRGQVIMSRNLVTGTYLGTDNLVQLVDTLGASVSAGFFLGSMGLPKPVKLFGIAEATFVRAYAHLRPVRSIQESLKYPYKNILVPLVKHDYGKLLGEAARLANDPNVKPEAKEAAIKKALAPFKETMGVGESFIITDTVSLNGSGQPSAGYKKLLSASLGLSVGDKVLARFHLHRKTEDEFHIYRDLGHEMAVGGQFDLDSLIPVLKAKWAVGKGNTRVKFYALNLNPKNPDVIKNISLLRRAVTSNSTLELDDSDKNKPFVLSTKYTESNPEVSLLFWQWKWNDSTSNITVKNPSGDKRYFKRTYKGQLRGRNYQSYANEVISHWVKLLFDKKAGLTDATGNNPGHSFKGVAKSKFITLDQEVDKSGKVIEPFVRISRVFNGWSIDKKKAEQILESLQTKYRYEFFNGPVLNDTRRIFLYNISVNLFFYEQAIAHLMKIDDQSVKLIFLNNAAQKNLLINPSQVSESELLQTEKTDAMKERLKSAKKMIRFLKRFKTYEAAGKENKANKYLLKALSHAEQKLNLKGLSLLVGGEQNLFMTSRIDGYRDGDEDGDNKEKENSLVSDSLGDFGSPRLFGPIVDLQQNLVDGDKKYSMLEGEFFVYWMMTRLL